MIIFLDFLIKKYIYIFLLIFTQYVCYIYIYTEHGVQ